MPDEVDVEEQEGEPTFGLHELADRSGLPIRTIRWYQSEGLLPKPAKHGRDAVYRAEHLERLGLIAELRDRGLTLTAIRDLVAHERPARTVAEWLGIDATLTAPWSDDRPRIVDRDELAALTGTRRTGLLAELQDAGYVKATDGGAWLVPSPALLDLSLQLHDAGIDVELSGKLRDLLRQRLAKAVDDAVKLMVERTGAGFAGAASPEEVATALGALRPIARETTSLILAQEVERALRELVGAGPAALEARDSAPNPHEGEVMSGHKVVLNQLNLVARDIDATIAFYQRLGLDVSDSGEDWPPGSGCRHVEVAIGNGLSLEFDNVRSASVWNSGVRDDAVAAGGRATAVIGFALPSREAVDAIYADLTAAGAAGRQPPYDAFWGARYAVVADPDGNDVGLMSPKDLARRFTPEV